MVRQNKRYTLNYFRKVEGELRRIKEKQKNKDVVMVGTEDTLQLIAREIAILTDEVHSLRMEMKDEDQKNHHGGRNYH